MNTWLKKMMIALLALGIGQAAWADDTLRGEKWKIKILFMTTEMTMMVKVIKN